MKNKSIFNKIFIIICLVLFISILTLIILGSINRKGYLSEFQLDESLSNISGYSYKFRIKYYSKIFRNSDIYNVYADTDKIIQNNNFIKEIKFNEKGTPFGTLTSSKELNTNDKIDNINYKLKIKLFTLLLFTLSILLIYLFTALIIKIIKCKNRRKSLVELPNNIYVFYIKYKKHIFILYSLIMIVFILFIIINSNIKYKSKLSNLDLIAESDAGYVYKAKIEDYKDNKLFSIDNNSIQLKNTNDIKYYGYALKITNKPLGSWNSTNIYYTDNNTFIISNESTNENAYYYNIQVPTYIGDKYKITILAKQFPYNGIIKWHLNGNNNFKEITKKEISNDYIVLTDTRDIINTADGVLDLHLMISQGVTEIESILIESLNTNLNSENGCTIFNINKKIDTLKIQYNIKLTNTSKYIIILLIIIFTLIFYIICIDNIKLLLNICINHIKLFLYSERFSKHRKYILISYSIIVVLIILFLIISFNVQHINSKFTNLELMSDSKLGYVYKAQIKDYKENKLFSINNNSIKINNTNNIKYYGYSSEITNKPLSSSYNTSIYYTKNNTFIISNKSINPNAYYYSIQVPTYIGDKYKITILAKQLPERGNISWHLNGANNFIEINNINISNDYIVLTDTREIVNSASSNLDFYLIIPEGITEIESILIESLNKSLNIDNNYTLFTVNKKIDTLDIHYNLKLDKKPKDIIVIIIIIYFLILIFYYRNYIQLKSNIFKYSLLISYIIYIIIGVYYHEPWRDEGQAWLIARDLSFLDIFTQTGIEGHPFLFFFIIKPFSFLPYYPTLNIINAIFVIIAIYFLLFKNINYNWIIKLLILFSTIILYEYPVVARNYGLSFLLYIYILYIYKYRYIKTTRYVFALGLFMNTTIMGISIGFIESLFFICKILSKKNNIFIKKKIKDIIILYLFLSLTLFQVLLMFYNRSIISGLNLFYFVSDVKYFYLLAMAIVLLLAIIFFVLIHLKVNNKLKFPNIPYAIEFISKLVLIFIFMKTIRSFYPLFERHLFIFNIYIIFILNFYTKNKSNLLKIAINIYSILIMYHNHNFGFDRYLYDIRYDFSGSKKAVKYIKDNNYDNKEKYIIIANNQHYLSGAISPYFKEKIIYDSGLDEFITFSDHIKKYKYNKNMNTNFITNIGNKTIISLDYEENGMKYRELAAFNGIDNIILYIVSNE